MPNIVTVEMEGIVQTGYAVDQFTTNNPRFRYTVRVYLDGLVLTEGKFATQGLANIAYSNWINEIKRTGKVQINGAS